MNRSASRPAPLPAARAAEPPFLAADVGGTNARIGLVRAAPDTRAGIELLHCERYACSGWSSLADILLDFNTRFGDGAVRRAVIACAGYVKDGVIVNVNLPWQVPIGPARTRSGLAQLDVINDFEALAHSVPALDGSALRSVVAPAAGNALRGLDAGPIVVMGPGTGLGCAAVLPGTVRDPAPRVLATEAAHIALAPGTPEESEILRVWSHGSEHVPVETALSGPGLLRLYRAIAGLRQLAAPLATPAEVTAAALAGQSQPALDALDVFCALLGSFAADLAILWQASGGVVLAGGILPQIEGFLLNSRFPQRFLRKGVLRPFLEHVPVHLIDHGDLGIVGAARWSLQQAAPG